jgi:hypothetical protein
MIVLHLFEFNVQAIPFVAAGGSIADAVAIHGKKKLAGYGIPLLRCWHHVLSAIHHLLLLDLFIMLCCHKREYLFHRPVWVVEFLLLS